MGKVILQVSIVVPVYRGADTLEDLVREIEPLTKDSVTPGGRTIAVSEVILVWDGGPDRSDAVIRQLEATHTVIKPVWLTRNFGQHAATVAGLSASTGDWVVTMDEDGQHNPADIPRLIDAAFDNRATLVYADPQNEAPHRAWRNAGSRFAKGTFMHLFVDKNMVPFHSFRIVYGDHARSVAQLAGHGMYLDVALQWVVSKPAQCPVELRNEGRPASNYGLSKLLAHFWRLVISVGTRPLRVISGVGFVSAAAGLALAAVALVQRLLGVTEVQGWTSSIVVQLVTSGFVMVALGVIAEYVGMVTTAALGRPLYVAGKDPSAAFQSESQVDSLRD